MTVSDMIVAESKEARQKNILMCQEAAQGKVDNRWLISKVNNHLMFIEPQTKVYGGMIVGEHNRDNDLEINVLKGKKLTNVRLKRLKAGRVFGETPHVRQ